MVNLMIKNIFENSSKIDAIAKYVSKMDTRYAVICFLITVDAYLTSKVVKKNKEKISELESKIEEMKSILA